MQPTNLQLLQGMQIGLGRLACAPEDSARDRLISQLQLAVTQLVARSTDRAASVRRAGEAARALALRGAALMRAAGRPLSLGKQAPVENSDDLPAQEAAYIETKTVLVDCVRALSEEKHRPGADDGWMRATDQWFGEVAEHEAQAAIDGHVQSSVVSISNREAFDVGKLAAYFALPRGERPAMQLIEARSLSGGFSRQTIMVTLLDGSQNRCSLIIRKQLSGGLLGTACLSLAQEIPYLELAHGAGVPVPQFLWYEREIDILGGEFIAMSHIRGSSLGTSVAAARAVDESIVRQLAESLARLHTIEWSSKATQLCPASGLPVDEEISASKAALAGYRAFEQLWRESRLGPLPALEIIADWLKRNVPTIERRPMLSHGDVGFHNMMGEAGRLTALLDWETARLADPAKDMAMVRNFITRYVPWNRFYGWYRDAGGPLIDDDSLDYYAVYHSFAHLLVCEVALSAKFAQSSAPDLEYLQLGVPVRAFFSKQMLASCARIWNRDRSPQTI